MKTGKRILADVKQDKIKALSNDMLNNARYLGLLGKPSYAGPIKDKILQRDARTRKTLIQYFFKLQKTLIKQLHAIIVLRAIQFHFFNTHLYVKNPRIKPQFLTQQINIKFQLASKGQDLKKLSLLLQRVKKYLISQQTENVKETPLVRSYLALFLNCKNEYRNIDSEGRKLESSVSFVRQKRKIKVWQVKLSQVKLVLNLKINFHILKKIEKTQQQIHRKLKKNSITIQKSQPQTVKIEIQEKILIQQNFYFKPLINVDIAVIRLDIYGDKVLSQKNAQAAPKMIRNRGCYIVIALKVFKETGISQFKCSITQTRYRQIMEFQKKNDELRIYLEKTDEKFYQIIKEKEELSQFEIESDEDIYS